MSMTEEEENRLRKLEGEVDTLTKRLDDIVDGIVSTIKNHPIWKHKEVPFITTERKNEIECSEGPSQLFSPEGITKFLKLCDNLKSFSLQTLERAVQTDEIKDLKNRLNDATVWNEIFDISMLAIKECVEQLEEKGDIDHGKECRK
jgi:hypothetical protein